MSTIQTSTITVSGMTCAHCTSAVTDELTQLPAVREVQVDLVTGGDSPVTITTDGPLDLEAANAAVVEAGYTVTA